MEQQALSMFNQTIKYQNQQIWIAPVCDFFNLNVQNQQRKLKKDSVLKNLWIKKSSDLGEIDKNGKILLSKKGFIRWIQVINVKTIRTDLQEKFNLYQSFIFDYFFGVMQSEDQAKRDYQKLKKYKKHYAYVGKEINRLEKNFNYYIENRFMQLSIDFENPQLLIE